MVRASEQTIIDCTCSVLCLANANEPNVPIFLTGFRNHSLVLPLSRALDAPGGRIASRRSLDYAGAYAPAPLEMTSWLSFRAEWRVAPRSREIPGSARLHSTHDVLLAGFHTSHAHCLFGTLFEGAEGLEGGLAAYFFAQTAEVATP